MKIDGTKFKEVNIGQEYKWNQDCEYGKKDEIYSPKQEEFAFAGLMLGNGFLKETNNIITLKPTGQHIVVLDRGFVYVGNVFVVGDYVSIKDAQCIRAWGTKNGLSELINGPLSTTKLDAKCDIITTIKSVIHFIKCKGF